MPEERKVARARRAEWHCMFTATGFIVICVAAEALRPDAEHVDRLAELLLELRAFGVGAVRAERPRGGDLGEVHAKVRGAAHAHADDGRRAGLAAGLEHA